MSDFHHLMMNTSGPEMDALCEEYAGFFRFAKILEMVASGIASGKIKVPGGRTVNKEHKLAAAIDLRVRQLEAKGVVDDAALLKQMVGHILDLQWLWSTVSDEKLAFPYNEVFLEHLCKYYWNNLQKQVLPAAKMHIVQMFAYFNTAYHNDLHGFPFYISAFAK